MAKTRAQRRSKLQETRIAKELGVKKPQSGSGNSWSAKSDVRKVGDLRIEAKYTDKNVFKLEVADLVKITNEALSGGLETPVMQVEFATSGRKYAVLKTTLFHNWFQFSHNETLQVQDNYCLGKYFRIDDSEVYAFRAKYIALGRVPVIGVTFERPGNLQWMYSIIDWDLFLQIYNDFKYE